MIIDACPIVRLVYSTSPGGRGRGNQGIRYLHVLAEETSRPGRQAMCSSYPMSCPVVLDPPPAVPPAELTWCPRCIGLLAGRLGVLDRVAAEVIAQASNGGADA